MLRRLTALCTGILEWFADAGLSPRTRIELNHNETMKSLLAADDGAAVLPLAHVGEQLHQRVQVVPLKPPEAVAGATRNLLPTLAQFRQA
ncbi:LysR family transcriptional regulator substrate-binding protein [Polaromonas sp. AET17H-212]|uniref:LysR family transcriptional regulator substrate-binding protein n=1 Tax=Polaromonas sp. AET17H-212 TaxID=1977061 RepID=UPI0011417961|nr:LysR family transcriptional regulator substrate-binding protein [Polaromonas sp. AET17H-212]